MCPTCERLAARATTPREQADTNGVKPAIILYFVYLSTLLLGSIGYAVAGEDRAAAAKVMIAIELFDTALILVWAVFRRKDVLPALRTAGPWWAYLLAVCLAPLTYTLATLALKFLRIWLGIETSHSFESLSAAGMGGVAVVLAIAVQPAVIEELAFRGMIQPGLARAMPRRDAVLAASAMFAIMHLSIPSFVHLMMLGIAVGGVRAISGSLYPSMLLHFLHNTTVLATDGLFSADAGGPG
ncbi:MAG: CPBP family intramembrane glutamic endopeptidase [Phycisphaerales bacterium]